MNDVLENGARNSALHSRPKFVGAGLGLVALVLVAGICVARSASGPDHTEPKIVKSAVDSFVPSSDGRSLVVSLRLPAIRSRFLQAAASKSAGVRLQSVELYVDDEIVPVSKTAGASLRQPSLLRVTYDVQDCTLARQATDDVSILVSDERHGGRTERDALSGLGGKGWLSSMLSC